MGLNIIDFLKGWQALKAEQKEAPLQRIKMLLQTVRQHRDTFQSPPLPTRPALNTEVAARFFTGLAAPLQEARQSGGLIDIWAVAGLKRKEVPNTAVLAWLLNPSGSHGQGNLCLKALLEQVALPVMLTALDIDKAKVWTEQRPLGSDRDRVDIVIDMQNLLLFIEVKIDAAEGHLQLERYVDSAERVALTRSVKGNTPATLVLLLSRRPPTSSHDKVEFIMWKQLSQLLASCSRQTDGYAAMLIRSFAIHCRSFG